MNNTILKGKIVDPKGMTLYQKVEISLVQSNQQKTTEWIGTMQIHSGEPPKFFWGKIETDCGQAAEIFSMRVSRKGIIDVGISSPLTF